MLQTSAHFDNHNDVTIQALQAVDGSLLTVPGDFFNLEIPPDLITEAGGMIPRRTGRQAGRPDGAGTIRAVAERSIHRTGADGG